MQCSTELMHQMLDVCLDVKNGENVWIHSWDHTIDLASEIAFACRQRGAHPSITLITESFWMRSLLEIPEKLLEILPKHEAAALDGASPFMQYWRITLPLLTPVIFFNAINGLISSLQIFTQINIMTGTGGASTMGGPNNASMMIVPYLFNNGFRFYKMGYASAIAWILFVLVMLLTLLVFRSSSAWVYYETEARK